MALEVVAISNRGASHLPDPIGIPTVISSTPGGTLYSTTPGGTRITYDRRTLLQYRNSPLSRTPPTDILAIPGITVPKDDSEQLSPPEHINCNDNLNLDNYVVNFNFKFYPANKNGVCKKKSKEKCKGESPQAIDTMNFYNKKFSKMTVFGDSNKSPKRNKEQHKESHREPHKEPHKEPHREQHREPNKEPHREPNKEQHREPNKEQHREPHKEQNKEPKKQQHREPSKQQHREPNKQQHREPHPTKQTLFKKMNEKENDVYGTGVEESGQFQLDL